MNDLIAFFITFTDPCVPDGVNHFTELGRLLVDQFSVPVKKTDRIGMPVLIFTHADLKPV